MIDLCSATLFKKSRRKLSIDVPEHRSILKNNQNTYYSRFSFTPKTGKQLRLKQVFVFILLYPNFRKSLSARGSLDT